MRKGPQRPEEGDSQGSHFEVWSGLFGLLRVNWAEPI